jgi:hypothetical protein
MGLSCSKSHEEIEREFDEWRTNNIQTQDISAVGNLLTRDFECLEDRDGEMRVRCRLTREKFNEWRGRFLMVEQAAKMFGLHDMKILDDGGQDFIFSFRYEDERSAVIELPTEPVRGIYTEPI